MKPLSLILALALCASSLALAAPRTEASDPDKIVCRKEPAIGTRLARKKCLTEAQWAEVRRESRELVEKLQRLADISGAK